MTVVKDLVSKAMDNVVEYCSKSETREQLEAKVLAPVVRYLADKFSWGVRLFQLVVILVFIQTLALFWLMSRVY